MLRYHLLRGLRLMAIDLLIIATLIFMGTIVVALLLDEAAHGTELVSAPWLPDPARTPGMVDAAVTEDMLCQTGKGHWSTKSIRPPEEYTTNLKRSQLAADPRYHSRNLKLYEEDHLISLEIGGHPTDPKNLWPEAWAGKCGAHVKDDLENKLHELVCAGKITLVEAQGEIADDWVRSYNLHIGKLSCP